MEEFEEKYEQHLSWLEVQSPPPENLKLIHEIFVFVTKNGGWARTIGTNCWKEFLEHPEPRKLFEANFLVSFERMLKNRWPYDAQTTKSIDFSLMESAPVYSEIRPDQWEEVLAEDLSIIKDTFSMGVPQSLMSLDSISTKYGEMETRILLQDSNPTNFIKKTISEKTSKLKDYISLMLSDTPEAKTIPFAVNFDFGEWKPEIDALRKHLPACLLWCTSQDSLSHLRQHIFGMTLPQLYLKITGCWTGAHEENLRFMSANINHGPSPCEWWGLGPAQSLEFRTLMKSQKKFEIYNSETRWWPDEIFCILNGLRLYHHIQLPGDLVVVGPGTIHWVKSCGSTVNSAWNFGPKKLLNFKRSFERDDINQKIGYRSIVPMNLLALDLLNSEIQSLDVGLVEFLMERLVKKAEEEDEVMRGVKMERIEVNNEDNVINCENCFVEILRVYFKCELCVKERLRGREKNCFFCFWCFKNVHLGKCGGKMKAVERFRREDFEKLLRVVKRRCEGEEVSAGFEELKYRFDKNTEEGVYVSPFNGVEFNDQAIV